MDENMAAKIQIVLKSLHFRKLDFEIDSDNSYKYVNSYEITALG